MHLTFSPGMSLGRPLQRHQPALRQCMRGSHGANSQCPALGEQSLPQERPTHTAGFTEEEAFAAGLGGRKGLGKTGQGVGGTWTKLRSEVPAS